MLVETSVVPMDACWTLRAISLRRRALLLDGGGDGRRDLDDLADRRADLADGGDAIAGGASPGPSIACRKPRRTTRRNSGATSF